MTTILPAGLTPYVAPPIHKLPKNFGKPGPVTIGLIGSGADGFEGEGAEGDCMMDKSALIFLDFDGVLNSAQWYDGRNAPHPCLRHQPFRSFDPACIARLNRVLRETGAQIVVSSSWRRDIHDLQTPLNTPDKMDGFLHCLGVEGRVVGMTPDLTLPLHNSGGGLWLAQTRGDEIRQWLLDAGLSGVNLPPYIAIDDDSVDVPEQHLVRTDYARGLTDFDADAAIRALLEMGANPVPGRLR